VIALDRPGYGLSDFQPGRAITDWPADVAQAADLLQIGRFSVAGASGGGSYALACAWRLPGRIVQAAVISGVGPFQVPGNTRGMRWQNQIGFKWGSRWPALARALMRSMHRNIAHLWQGEADMLVPAAMGRYQAAQIPRCHFTLLPGEAHLLIIDRMPDLAAALRPAAPPRSPGES
jgi:pimeloyl-ACP methyl ester carboxylesterase